MTTRLVTLAPQNTPCEWTRAHSTASDVTMGCATGDPAIHVLTLSLPGIPQGTAVCGYHSPYDVTPEERATR